MNAKIRTDGIICEGDGQNALYFWVLLQKYLGQTGYPGRLDIYAVEYEMDNGIPKRRNNSIGYQSFGHSAKSITKRLINRMDCEKTFVNTMNDILTPRRTIAFDLFTDEVDTSPVSCLFN